MNDLSHIPYQVMDIFDDVNDTLWIWNQLTMQVVNEHAPIKTKTVTCQRVPYMNGELRRAIMLEICLKANMLGLKLLQTVIAIEKRGIW